MKAKHWMLVAAVIFVLYLISNTDGDGVDPSKWTCDSLVNPIIEMSQKRFPTVLEINDPQQRGRLYGPTPSISCFAGAEWTQGYGAIEYGARVTDGGNVILTYEQR